MIQGHGGDVFRVAKSLSVSPRDIKDFSSNISPLPLPDGLKERLIASLDEIRALPEVDSLTVRESLAARYKLDPENFLIGSGTTEWIYSLPRVMGTKRALIPLPTYADYVDAAAGAGCKIETLGPWLHGGQDTSSEILNTIKERMKKGDIVFICNPNNPTGHFIPLNFLLDAIYAESDVLWVIDESYAPFVGSDSETSLISSSMPANILILRSFSKIYGIPGLRLGYATGTIGMMKKLGAAARPWAVNRLAQVAGEYLIERFSYENDVRDYCRHEKERFLSRIKKEIRFLTPIEGRTHFILFKIKPPLMAKKIADTLKKKKILIRDCGNFRGLYGEYLRISLRSHEDNDALLGTLKEFNHAINLA